MKESPWCALIGNMGAGKSSVGQSLAAATDRAFVDLDRWLETRWGAPVTELIGRRGIAWFRSQELSALAEVLDSEPGVLSLGGGCFLQSQAREMLDRASSITVWLDARPEVLMRRCASTPGARPLAPEGLSGWERLALERDPVYGLCTWRVDVNERTVEETVELLRERLELVWSA